MAHDLHLPDGGTATAAAVVVHPHPAMGGDRHHPLVIAVAEGLAATGIAALRPDLDNPDIAASATALEQVAADLAAEVGTDRLLLIGYSWGSIVASAAAPEGLAARVLVAPPVAMFALSTPTVPTLVLVPAHDQYGGPDAVHEVMEHHENMTIEVIEGCDHFLAGAVAHIATRAVAWSNEQL